MPFPPANSYKPTKPHFQCPLFPKRPPLALPGKVWMPVCLPWILVFLPAAREGNSLAHSGGTSIKSLPTRSLRFPSLENMEGNRIGMLGFERLEGEEAGKSVFSSGLGTELMLGKQTLSSLLLLFTSESLRTRCMVGISLSNLHGAQRFHLVKPGAPGRTSVPTGTHKCVLKHPHTLRQALTFCCTVSNQQDYKEAHGTDHRRHTRAPGRRHAWQ